MSLLSLLRSFLRSSTAHPHGGIVLGGGAGGGGGVVPAVNTVAPTITGTRGGTLTRVAGTWTGATGGVTGQWYADGVATGIVATTFTDSDTTKTIEYRETALPGSVTASGWRGASTSAPLFLDDFEGYADQTRLAQFKSDGVTATALPHDTNGWRGDSTDDTDGTGSCQDWRIVGGRVQKHSWNGYYTVRDHGTPGGTFDLVLPYGGGDQRYTFAFSVTLATGHDIVVFLRNAGGTASLSVHTDVRAGIDVVRASFTFPGFADGDTLRVILDNVAKTIALQLNGTTVGAASYDLSGWAGPWSNFHGFSMYGADPAVGTNLLNSWSYDSLGANSVSATIASQPSGLPGKKQINVTAAIGVPSATGAQYKVETVAGVLVQGWTAMAYAGTTGAASCLIPDFAYEGQQFRILARNVGGATVKIVSQLTAANGYALQQKMRLGLNDSFYNYWGAQVAGRDIFEQFIENQPLDMTLVQAPLGGGASHDSGILLQGATFIAYAHWDEAYNPAQNYPSSAITTDDNYAVCSLNGVQWARTSHTPRSGVAPDPTDPNGSVSGWRRAFHALGSTVGMSTAGLPTQHPTDANLVISVPIPWNGFKASRYPVTVHCRTEGNTNLTLTGPSNVSMTNKVVGLPYTTFDLVYTGEARGSLVLDRTTPISAAWFISGVPTYETGAPAADIGAPYPSIDKLADFAPFWGRRHMTGSNINRDFGAPHNGMTAANNAVGGVRRQWKYDVDLTNRCGHRANYANEPDWADSTIRVARATYHLANLSGTVLEQMVEYVNEIWLNSHQSVTDLNSRAASAGVAPVIQYARELKLVLADWESVWTGANRARLKGVAAWQSTINFTDLTSLLDEGNLYQHLGYFAIAPYFGVDANNHDLGSYTNTPTAIRNAVLANDQAAYNAAASTLMRSAADVEVSIFLAYYNWLPGYSVSRGLNKNAIQMASYEANYNIIFSDASLAAWDAGLGAGMGARAIAMSVAYKRSATAGGDVTYFINQMNTYCPHTMMLFDYAENAAGNKAAWSHMDTMGAVSQETYASVKTLALALNV